MEGNEKIDFIKKADMAINHISDCILKLEGNCAESISEMAKALAELIQARAYAEHLICPSEEQ